jgi:hypothetical protein
MRISNEALTPRLFGAAQLAEKINSIDLPPIYGFAKPAQIEITFVWARRQRLTLIQNRRTYSSAPTMKSQRMTRPEGTRAAVLREQTWIQRTARLFALWARRDSQNP